MKITVAYMRDLEKQVNAGEISFGRMVELINERTAQLLPPSDWTKGCQCDPQTRIGETWCCNQCGCPTKRTPPPAATDIGNIFKKWSSHKTTCEVNYEANGDCDCGWYAALQKINAFVSNKEAELKDAGVTLIKTDNLLTKMVEAVKLGCLTVPFDKKEETNWNADRFRVGTELIKEYESFNQK